MQEDNPSFPLLLFISFQKNYSEIKWELQEAIVGSRELGRAVHGPCDAQQLPKNPREVGLSDSLLEMEWHVKHKRIRVCFRTVGVKGSFMATIFFFLLLRVDQLRYFHHLLCLKLKDKTHCTWLVGNLVASLAQFSKKS